MNISSLVILLSFVIVACGDETHSDNLSSVSVPIYSGDHKAIALAQQVIDGSGGIENWNNIKYISFDFFGSRQWHWDKHNNRYRVESQRRNFRAAGKLDGSEINLWLNGKLETNSDSLARYREFAYHAWINDTYWLVFPFKLLDPGVTLHYKGSCLADSLTTATCIQLTFDSVGVTPQNKYVAYIDTRRMEIIRWDYYESKDDSIISVSNSWKNYKNYGLIKLSSIRGDDSIGKIAIDEKLPDDLFKHVDISAKDILVKHPN